MQVKVKLWMIAVCWPSFLLAVAATGVFFSAFDPEQLMPFGRPAPVSRLAAYSTGFFAFWLFSALSIAGGLYFAAWNGPQGDGEKDSG